MLLLAILLSLPFFRFDTLPLLLPPCAILRYAFLLHVSLCISRLPLIDIISAA